MGRLAVDRWLSHFGVPGMKWGVTRSRDELKKARSSDANNVRDIKKKGRQTKIASLSNAELQQAIQRMNLERQYTSLAPSPSQRVNKALKSLIGAGKTANEIVAFGNSPAGKAIGDKIADQQAAAANRQARKNYNRSYK